MTLRSPLVAVWDSATPVAGLVKSESRVTAGAPRTMSAQGLPRGLPYLVIYFQSLRSRNNARGCHATRSVTFCPRTPTRQQFPGVTESGPCVPVYSYNQPPPPTPSCLPLFLPLVPP